MRIKSECISCIIDDMKDALDLLSIPRKTSDLILSEGLTYLGGHFQANDPPSYYITEIHRIIKKRLSLDMPFAELRQICLEACKEIAFNIDREAAALSGIDKMRFLIKWAIASNALDFRTAGTGYEFATDRIEQLVRGYFDSGLNVDDTDRIYSLVKNARNIVYVPDNVGELPFDKMLIAECASYGATFTMPFRGGPITSDVVIADGKSVQFEDIVDHIILSGPDTLGISFKEMTDSCRNALKNADVIIAKGQANFYVLSEFGTDFPQAAIISLFVTKCECISDMFGLGGKVNIAVVLKEANGAIKMGKENQ